MSIRDVMMLNSKTTTMPLDKKMDDMLLSAGTGDFSRTLFERSSINLNKPEYGSKMFTLSKSIAPVDGIYKISFEAQVYYTPSSASVPFAYINLLSGEIRADWYINAPIGDGFGFSRIESTMYSEQLFNAGSLTISNEWRNVECYFYFRKGECFVVHGSRINSVESSILILGIKNFKITY